MKDHPQTNVRIAWWLANGGMWPDVALSVKNLSELPDTPIEGAVGCPTYREGEPPVLVGHYKMQGPPRIDAKQAACLDYPERYCVYHWGGETELHMDNLRSRAPEGVGDDRWS